MGEKGEERYVEIPIDEVRLEGILFVLKEAEGIVLFAHGSGSSRFSPRNRFVASALHDKGLATLLMDLLTWDEEQNDMRRREHRFNITLLSNRLIHSTQWLQGKRDTKNLNLGYFGSSTGAAAALIAAAKHPEPIRAIVSRGGRTDLTREGVPRVKAPTLLIAGGRDVPVIAINR